jgi:PKD repeat protein
MRCTRNAVPKALVVPVMLATIAAAASLVPAQASAAPFSQPPQVQQRTSSLVTDDVLPTVQIDSGVVWTTVVVGNTVYAGGQFTNTRPAGAAAGTNLTPRSNLLAFNLTTGNLITTFAPTFNGAVKSLAVSPDGGTLYVGGAFNSVNGTEHYNLAAFNTATGALNTSFNAQIGGSYVNAIAATSTTVYVGGLIGAANGTTRKNLAAVTTAGKLVNWAPSTDLQVDAMVLTPAKDKLIIGGRFGQVNGVTQRGLAALSLIDGSMLPWLAPNTVIDGGGPSGASNYGMAGIWSLSADATNVYGTGWVFADTSIGNLEGSFSADPTTGAIKWLEDCHGDTYSAYSDGTNVYTVSHNHDCTGDGAFPNKTPAPGNLTHAQAFTAAVEGTLTRPDVVSNIYKDWEGQPAPAMINWYPQFVTGSFTGQGQAAWTITGNGTFVVAGGEFPIVNGKTQQGLVRFAIKPISGAHNAPQLAGTKWVPTASAVGTGSAKVSIAQNYDYDDLNLTYNIMRTGTATPVFTVTKASPFWTSSPITFTDTGLATGTYTYQVIAVDSDGNQSKSATVSVTVNGGANHANPVPRMTLTPSGLTVSADASGSTASDGATLSYDWNWGDGSADGSGVTASHTYAANGTYTVVLTLHDSLGGSASTSQTLVVSSGAVATDTFSRTSATNWGTADVGGAWTAAAGTSVSGGVGLASLAAGVTCNLYLNSVNAQDVDATIAVSLDKLPAAGTAPFNYLLRSTAAGDYRLKMIVSATGGVTEYLARYVGTTETILATNVLTGFTYVPGTSMSLRFQLTTVGASSTLKSMVWPTSTTAPTAFQLTTTDSTAALQGPGRIGLSLYVGKTVTSGPLTFSVDQLQAV